MRLADREGEHEINAGSLECFEQESQVKRPSRMNVEVVFSIAFGRFVHLSRRQLRMSVEELAARAEIDPSEIVSIESDPDYVPEPSAVHQLAKVLQVPSKNLMQLARLTTPKDPRMIEETVRFAAHSESIAKLTSAERQALEHFVAVLNQEK